MILAAIAYIVLVLILYRLESGQLDREALRQGRLTILRQPRQRMVVHIWSKPPEASWRVEEDDDGW